MSCGNKNSRPAARRINSGKRSAGLMVPANIGLDEDVFTGYKVKAKPVKYNAVYVDVKSPEDCDKNFTGWLVSIFGNEIFVPEEDMIKYFELIKEMEIPFEDEMPPEMREEYIKRRDKKKTKTEEVI